MPAGRPDTSHHHVGELTATIVVALLAGAGPAVAVWGHGPVGRRAAVVLLGCTLVWSGLVRLALLDRSWWWVLLVAVPAGLLVVSSMIGRAPGLLAVAGVVVASSAIPPRPGPADAATQPIATCGLLLLCIAEVVWASEGFAIATVALLSLAAVLVASSRLAVGPASSLDRRIAGGASAVSRAGLRQVRTAWSSLRRTLSTICPVSLPAAVAAGSAAVALVLPVVVRLVDDPSARVLSINDYRFHIQEAQLLSVVPLRLPAPHPLFHLSLAVLGPIANYQAAAIVVAGLAAAATGIVLVGVAGRLEPGVTGPNAATLFALVWLVVESPAVVLRALGVGVGPVVGLRVWGSPTELVLVPCALLLLGAAGVVVRGDVARVGGGFGVIVILVVAGLAKPSVLLVLVPAAVIVAVLRSDRSRSRCLTVLRVLVLPAVVLVAAQVIVLTSGSLPSGRSGFELDPLGAAKVAGLPGDLITWVLPCLVLVTMPLVWRRLRHDVEFHLSVTSIGVALPVMALIRETGPRSGDGSLLKLGLIAALLVFTCWLRAVVAEIGRLRGARWDLRASLLVAVLAVLVIAGGASYAVDLGVWSPQA